jgi:sialate O-acetylesterase
MRSPSIYRASGFLILLLLVLGNLTARAEDRVASIFRDGMVLQREKPVAIWGWGTAGEQVQVTFNGQTKQGQVDDHGYWKVMLDSMTANNEGQVLDVKIGSTEVSLKDVLIGEVWIAAGQSNMVVGGPDKNTGVYPFYVSPPDAGAKAQIRISRFGGGVSLDPQDDVNPAYKKSGNWQPLKDPYPATMDIPQYFSRVLRDALNVPVGMIVVAVPGTNEGAWMSKETLQAIPGEGGAGTYYDQLFSQNNATLAKAGGPYASWDTFAQADAAWLKDPQGASPEAGWPGSKTGGLDYQQFPSVLYNTRIHPLAPLSIRGVIWHQGEAGPGGPYGERLVAMAKQWRDLFGQPFYFIWGTLGRNTSEPPPLAPYTDTFYRSLTSMEIRHALDVFAGDKSATFVEFYDLGNEGTHFLEKAEAGRRMGLAALDLAYNQPHLYSGPHMVDTKIDGGTATIHFDRVGTGLSYQPSIDGISGFFLQGKSGTNQWGQVTVTGKDTIQVSSPDIPDLAMVAYGDNLNPHETLFNSDNLPASPFVVNDTKKAAPKPATELVSLTTPSSDADFNISHVRRDGYVFQVKPVHGKTSAGPVTVQAYIPKEWQDYEVQIGGQPATVIDAPQNGIHFVTFSPPTDGTWVIVAAKGKAAEFQKVNRF